MIELSKKREYVIDYINELEAKNKIRKGSYGTLINKALRGKRETVEKLDKAIQQSASRGKVSWSSVKNIFEENQNYLSKAKKQLIETEKFNKVLQDQLRNYEAFQIIEANQRKLNRDNKLKFKLSESALNGTTKTYQNVNKLRYKDVMILHSEEKKNIEDKIKNIYIKNGTIKFKISVDAELIFERDNIKKTVGFSSPFFAVLNYGDVKKRVKLAFTAIKDSLENYKKASAIIVKNFENIKIGFVKYNPLKGSSYIDLPKWIKDKKACVNVKNNDNKCFLWAIASALNPVNIKAERTSNYKIDQFKVDGLEFPMKVDKIKKFEEMNDININVITYEGKGFTRIYTNDKVYSKNVDLLLIYDDTGKSHYVWIKNFSRLMGSVYNAHRKMFYCRRCLSRFLTEDKLKEHQNLCLKVEAQTITLPKKGEVYEFNNWQKMQKVPFVIYADFEAILPKVQGAKPNPNNSYTEKTEKHKTSGFCFKTVCIHEQFNRPEVLYRGKDADKKFVDEINKEMVRIMELYKNEEKIRMTEKDKENYKKAKVCYICRGEFDETDNGRKVRDHDHLTGDFRGAAHQYCNKKFRYPSFIPVIFHNLRGYDSHFIINNIKDQFKNISCIPNNEEKYISFSLDKLRFIDSFQFMADSLESLVENVKKNGNDDFRLMKEKYGDKCNFMLGKGIYFYEYADSFKKFKSEEKPKKEDFYSSLNDSHISDEDYARFCDVWDKMKIKNIGEYHDLYLVTDVLQLADVFEKFRKTCLEYYELDPAHYYTSPGLSWDALLKMTGVKLEALNEMDKYLFFELGKRGGVSMISHRYAKANNQYLDDYDNTKPNKYLIDLDANNLYGWAMCQYLPVSGFKWEDDLSKFTEEYIKNIPDDSKKGYFLSVDVTYPKELHDIHNDLPFLPENIAIDKVSPYCENLMNNLSLKPAKVKKLVPNLNDKKEYIIHYVALKQALRNGLKLEKVNKVISFNQEPWMKPYIEFNTEKRKQAKDKFEKDFFKLMNNSVFGKTMENIRNRINFTLVNNEKKMKKLTNKPTFKDRVIFNENLVGVHMLKNKVELNKPIYVGCSVLDLSKTLMYDFHYDFIKRKYGNKAKLLGTDTDSLKYVIETEDLYKDMKKEKERFDFSEYPEEHFCYDESNKKVLGKMKDELNGKVMTEFVGLRAKMYVQSTKDKVKKVAKGIKKSVIEKDVTVENYKQALFEGQNIYKKMKSFRSYKHQLYTIEVNKSGLCAYDDKRYVLEDGVSTLAHGHYKI